MDEGIAAGYRRFAEIEARGVSDIYFDWATGVAEDAELTDLIAQLPPGKRQPNLVFAASRHLGAPAGPYPAYRDWLVRNWDATVPVILARATQTNEAARCAVLLPVLSRLSGPLALIEAGASAGLCLYPDRYSYRYDVDGRIVALDPVDGAGAVQIPCAIDEAGVPDRLPGVVWRAGVDLNPIDAADDEDVAWLETLVWPEHDARRERLRRAARIAAADPPELVRGDILTRIPELIDRAPADAHVVVFHSAVLVYLDPEERQEFADGMLARRDVTWISNEGAGVLPSVTAQVTKPVDGRLILAVDGTPIALTGPHGQSYESVGESARDQAISRSS